MSEKASVPAIRFKGFTDPWEQRTLSSLCSLFTDGDWIEAKDQSYNGVRLIQTGNVGVGKYLDKGDRAKWISEDTFLSLHCTEIVAGDILISRLPEPAGRACVVPELDERMITAVDCTICRTSPDCESGYLLQYLCSGEYLGAVRDFLAGGTRQRISRSNLANFNIPIPSVSEQKEIGNYLGRLDNLITLHQRKHDKLTIFKKSMLEKMFPKPGSDTPEIRFKGFSDPWEQRKFSDLVLIERGGSPRPIDAYITEDPTGLNWVKIGDAPSMGRYITSTSEKIKPEGLSKTRQVYPGDLVLSNSMSFGRPYIMAVEGCIHDGWLLIRDAQNQFDPVFLCHMLGAPQMLDQYRMFASGSTVNNLNKELVGNATVPVPNRDEQVKIGKYLDGLDSLITLHQRELELLKKIKQSCLEKMFV